MADEQGTRLEIQLDLTPAAQEELRRIIRVADQEVRHSYASTMRPYLFRIIRTVHPEVTRDYWVAVAGAEPAMLAEDDPNRAETLAREREALEADRALLRQYGRALCCAEHDRRDAARLREEIALGHVAPVAVPEEDEEAPAERTCTCDGCTDDECQGDCNPCNDHGCEQCFDGHTVYDCCGYCEQCEYHPNNVDSPNYRRCAECNHCSECEHYCD